MFYHRYKETKKLVSAIRTAILRNASNRRLVSLNSKVPVYRAGRGSLRFTQGLQIAEEKALALICSCKSLDLLILSDKNVRP